MFFNFTCSCSWQPEKLQFSKCPIHKFLIKFSRKRKDISFVQFEIFNKWDYPCETTDHLRSLDWFLSVLKSWRYFSTQFIASRIISQIHTFTKESSEPVLKRPKFGQQGRVVEFNSKETEHLDVFRIKKTQHGTGVVSVSRCLKLIVPTPPRQTCHWPSPLATVVAPLGKQI